MGAIGTNVGVSGFSSFRRVGPLTAWILLAKRNGGDSLGDSELLKVKGKNKALRSRTGTGGYQVSGNLGKLMQP